MMQLQPHAALLRGGGQQQQHTQQGAAAAAALAQRAPWRVAVSCAILDTAARFEQPESSPLKHTSPSAAAAAASIVACRTPARQGGQQHHKRSSREAASGGLHGRPGGEHTGEGAACGGIRGLLGGMNQLLGPLSVCHTSSAQHSTQHAARRDSVPHLPVPAAQPVLCVSLLCLLSFPPHSCTCIRPAHTVRNVCDRWAGAARREGRSEAGAQAHPVRDARPGHQPLQALQEVCTRGG